MQTELRKLMNDVDAVMQDLAEFNACDLPERGDLPPLQAIHGQGQFAKVM